MIFRPHKKFKKSFTKLSKTERRQLDEALKCLVADPSDPKLKNHILHRQYAGCNEITLSYDLRLIYEEVDGVALLLKVGTHNQLFG
ncbi:MAG: addiction module RelE/StbE family toxin [Candidatus Azotimanducaceae bacterium]|jgi:addiction module RelE/StbE family toxin